MVTLKQILCPVDFSDASRHALRYAVVFGRRYGAAIMGLHVYPVTVFPNVSGYPPFLPSPPDADSLEQELRTFLAPAQAAGLFVDALVEGGDAAGQIIARASSLPADLVVMGTHGLSGFERFALGSVAEKVLRKAEPPVLTVPPAASWTENGPFTRFLCALDFSPSSLAGLRFATSLARDAGAGLSICHVLEDLPDERAILAQPLSVSEYWRERETDARRQLAALVPTDLPLPAKTVLRHGKPYREILAAATAEHADVIVLGIHARSALDLAILGSTTNQVVRRASCPVVTVRF